MFRKRLKNEAGYSLVEVMASIIVLAIGILPLIGMLNMGINSATKGGQYEKARALANLKMEEAKSRSFAEVEGNFPQAGNTTPYTTVNWINGPGGFTGFQYRVEKHYIAQPETGQDGPVDPTQPFDSDPGEPTGLIRVTVIVQWGDGNTYTTYGLVGQ
ncbi:MAG: prepilin-type N-terminal cleavage/methylation domain-containing protein [Rubrobacteraceae bacterium]|nr:prepilin-type N-terminal cleavage/methylation domain-containing protein [Rubrobacteraceae bacterium]